jgi:hypothetical protein
MSPSPRHHHRLVQRRLRRGAVAIGAGAVEFADGAPAGEGEGPGMVELDPDVRAAHAAGVEREAAAFAVAEADLALDVSEDVAGPMG